MGKSLVISQAKLAKLKSIKHIVLDMDGTVYLGNKLFKTTPPFFQILKQLNISWTFLTNNSSKSVGSYLKHIRKLGLEGDVYTSTLLAIDYMKKHFPDKTKLFVLGTNDVKRELSSFGFKIVDADPDIVLICFDTSLTFRKLCRSAYWISKGKVFIGTHPDPTCPTDKPTIWVDCGSIVKCLEYATGQKAIVLGKPLPDMLRAVANKVGVDVSSMVMVGDRVMTDIKMAKDAGAVSVLIGDKKPTGRIKPDFIVPNLLELGKLVLQAKLGKSD